MKKLLLAVGLASHATHCPAQAPDLARAQVNGTEIAYVERGQGEPVILIHGFMWDLRVWEAPLTALSTRYRVVAYSRRHHWPNPSPSSEFAPSMAAQAADLAALIRTLDAGPAHLVGHSAGANIALLVAREHPELVASLVLGEPGPALMPHLAPPRGGLAGARDTAREAFLAGDDEAAVRVLVGAISQRGREDAQRDPQHWRVFMDNLPITRVQVVAGESEPPPSLSCTDVGAIPAPALVVSGELSAAPLQAVARELVRCLGRAEPVTIPGAGHGLYLQNPDAFHEAVFAFLARNARDRERRTD